MITLYLYQMYLCTMLYMDTFVYICVCVHAQIFICVGTHTIYIFWLCVCVSVVRAFAAQLWWWVLFTCTLSPSLYASFHHCPILIFPCPSYIYILYLFVYLWCVLYPEFTNCLFVYCRRLNGLITDKLTPTILYVRNGA